MASKIWALFFSCYLLGFSLCPRPSLAVEAPANPINDRGQVWEKKAVSTASGMIHIQWRACSADSYRIYRAEGEQNPFSSQDRVTIPWQSDLQDCFFRYLPEDSDEGKRFWFLVRAVKDQEESQNLDAESVVVDLPWINGRNDPNSINFYVEDEQRSDSFLQQSHKCPFCSESNKTYFRLARARLLLKRDYAWYYLDRAYDPAYDIKTIADCFETEIYPTNLAWFGQSDNEWSDVDGNAHIIILFTRLGSSIDGYFNSDDKLPKHQFQNYVGNCSDMFYISCNSLSISIKRTIAHEFQHMQHFEADASHDGAWEELWLDEACSEFATEVNNFYFRGMYYYRSRPNEISLTRFGYSDVHDRFGGCPIHWDKNRQNFEAISRVIAHYEQAGIWAHYMEYNASPITSMKSLVEDPNRGLISVQNHLGLDFRQAFINFSLANYLNPYTEDDRYHYTAQFSTGAELIETQRVRPINLPTANWIKSPEQTPEWSEKSLRDLSADYLLLPNNGLREDHVHWEIKEINDQENVCHLALVDRTDPASPFLHEVMELPLLDTAGALSVDEGETDLSSCLIITNLASYQDSNYVSSYQYRAYLTRSPQVQQVKLSQGQHEWLFEGSSSENNESLIYLKAGLLHINVQFDQSMSENNGLSICLEPQGAQAEPVRSCIKYPADTWQATMVIPPDKSEQWDGLANLKISGGQNFWHEQMKKDERFSFYIDTLMPRPVTIKSISLTAGAVQIKWDKAPEPDLLGYRLYGTSNEPIWIPQSGLSDPNHPAYSCLAPAQGIYSLVLTALDQAGNESAPSEPTGLAVQVKIPLRVGLNIVSYPVQPPLGYTSDIWLGKLGPSTISIRKYQPGDWLTTYWQKGIIMGNIFPLLQGGGYVIYCQKPRTITLSGVIKKQPVSVHPGKNVLGVPLENESSLDFYRTLAAGGEPVSSIHYYQSREGKWRSNYDFFGQIAGYDTKIKKGAGCLVESKGW